MRRYVDRARNRVGYVIPERELLQKLGIPERMSKVYYSYTKGTLTIVCNLPEQPGK